LPYLFYIYAGLLVFDSIGGRIGGNATLFGVYTIFGGGKQISWTFIIGVQTVGRLAMGCWATYWIGWNVLGGWKAFGGLTWKAILGCWLLGGSETIRMGPAEGTCSWYLLGESLIKFDL